MPSCDYCGETFADEESYLDHLGDAHEGDLGRIDQRRVDEHRASDAGALPSTGVLVGAAVVLLIAVGGAYALFGGGGASGEQTQSVPTPHGLWDVHYHGQITMIVDGQRVDFSQDKYQVQADAFHFEGGDGQKWHGHAHDVTLQWAMATLDIGVTKNSVTFQGTTYTDGQNAQVTVTINGDPVNPRTYILQDGDDIRIVVESS